MHTSRIVLLSCSVLAWSAGAALAGPCTDRTAKDAGSGPAQMGSQQTTGMAEKNQHPPTSTMNRATGDVAASSQDTRRQMQGNPTAAQQAEGAKSDKQAANSQGCD